MCYGCWESDGKPFEYTPSVAQWAPVFGILNPFGALHAVISDWNLDDSNIQTARANKDVTPEEIKLCDVLLSMSDGERWATAIIADWPEIKTAEEYENGPVFTLTRTSAP